ncbi:MAG: hypothetical protein KQH63_12220 [Desulfobulbaceae bacterium]|nr:hypothetical protein [Desulfobulbaceae bacterium]
MDFQAHLKNMWQMMQEEFVVFFVGGMLIQLLVSVTLGILTGPLMGGYLLLMVHWLKTGERCEFNDLFSGMQRFAALFPAFFLVLLVFLGFMLFILPGVVMTVWWVYVVILMADKNMTMGEAMNASKDKVSEKGFFMHFVFLLMISVVPTFLLAIVAALIPPLAVLQYFLFPLQCACVASLYLEQFEGINPAERGNSLSRNAPPPPPSEPPVPPTPPPLPPTERAMG